MNEQRYTRSFANNAIFVGILILGIILLSGIYILRFYNYDNKNLFSDDSYYNLRISKLILENKGVPLFDDLSYGGRPFAYSLGWPILIVWISKITNLTLEEISILLPIIFGFLTSLLIGLIISKLTKNKNIRNLSLLILLLSPPFLYLFSASNAFAAVIFLTSLGFYLLLFDKKILSILAMLFMSAITFFSFFSILFVIFLFFIYAVVRDRKKIKWFLLFLVIVIIFEIFNHYNLLSKYGLPEQIRFKIIQSTINFSYQALFSDFGGKFGLSLFSVFLLFLGIYVLWTDKKYKYFYVYLSVLLLLLISIYFNFVIFYLNIIIAIIGSIGLIKLLNRKWESQLIKNLSIGIVIIGIIFSGISFINQLALSEPTKKQIEALSYLKAKSAHGAVVFSYYDRGFWFTHINKKNVMDPNFFYAPLVNERWQDSLNLLYSKKIEDTIAMLNKYDIEYIWIDKAIRERFYGDRETNLLYQLRNDPRFKLVFKNFNEEHQVEVEIWEYEKSAFLS